MEAHFVFLSLLATGAASLCFSNYRHLNITAPKIMTALKGSCVQVPCEFHPSSTNVTGQKAFGVWIKSDSDFATSPHNVIFNGSSDQQPQQVRLVGDLGAKNCTTVFENVLQSFSDKYFFRIESGPFKATAVCTPVEIQVQETPPKPTIQTSGSLTEGSYLNVSCSVLTSCENGTLKLAWNLKGETRHQTLDRQSGIFTVNIQTSILLSYRQDGLTINCSVQYPAYGSPLGSTDQRMLNVSYAPKNTSIHPGWLLPGSVVNLTCSTRANPTHLALVRRMANGTQVEFEGAFHSLNVTEGEVYWCLASNDLGNQTSAEIRATGEPENLRWQPVVGGVLGLILVLGIIGTVWCLKPKQSAAPSSQSPTAVEQSASTREEENGDLHYGEINFSQPRSQPSSAALQGQQTETVYAKIRVSQTGTESGPAEGLQDIYAEVKK